MNIKISCDRLRDLQAHLSPERWEARIKQAHQRLAVVEALRSHNPTGKLSRASVRAVAPKESWSSVRRWWKWYHTRECEPWERMVDRRKPNKPWETLEPWKNVIRVLGRQQPQPSLEQIRQALITEFGSQAALNHATLRRILKEADLQPLTLHRGQLVEQVTELSGGGGLLLLLAAIHETNGLKDMANGVIALACAQPVSDKQVIDKIDGRNERGQLTCEYNQKRLENRVDSENSGIFRSIEKQRPMKDLSRLRLCSMSAATLENYLRCLVALPLLSTRRGVVGLDGPAGGWLKVLSPVAYRSVTTEKILNELKWLDAGPTIWESHAQTWLYWSRQWAGENWRQLAYYVDATQDPWWTQEFAKSTKVSRTGRVQPCLTRTILSSGPGVPIIAEVVSGHVDLVEQMRTMMNTVDRILGEDALSRITIVDSECCQIEVVRRFINDPQHDIITVVKGQLAAGKKLENLGKWQVFRKQDQLREGQINLEPKKDDKLMVRVVEMCRPNSRNPISTWFLTTTTKDTLNTKEVAEAYLSRWPFQEDLFRRGRNGVGLQNSHGFGKSKVENIAIIGKREAAARKQQKAAQAFLKAEETEAKAAQQLHAAHERLQERKQADSKNLNGRHTIGIRQAKIHLKKSQKNRCEAERNKKKADREYQKLGKMPDKIYVRDTALDAVTTCLKMTLLALLEFICQEYLGQNRIMPRTFAEAWISLPVTIRESRHQILYEVTPNHRDPKMTRLLDEALRRITQRKLRLKGRLMVVRIKDEP